MTLSAPVTPARLLTTREAADYLRVSTRTLFSLSARGELPAVRIGRAVRYSPAALADYVARQQARGGAA